MVFPSIRAFVPNEIVEIPIEAIKSATNNFSDDNLIGWGGFGNVYKGQLVDTTGTKTTTVAVKRLNRERGQGLFEFRKEIVMLSRLIHENIVSLIGFHDGNEEKIIVYEFADNGSLDSQLENQHLTWGQRLTICRDTAYVLDLLQCPPLTPADYDTILHRDIKSANILLDGSWNPKLSDFGLAKHIPAANQQDWFMLSNAVGTKGYMDPLYAKNGWLTKESDVYSFGVVMFEVLCGRLNHKPNHRPLIDLVRQHYEAGTMMEIVFDKIKDQIHPDSLKAFTAIAYRCLDSDHRERPSMKEIVKALESALQYQLGSTREKLDEKYFEPSSQRRNVGLTGNEPKGESEEDESGMH